MCTEESAIRRAIAIAIYASCFLFSGLRMQFALFILRIADKNQKFICRRRRGRLTIRKLLTKFSEFALEVSVENAAICSRNIVAKCRRSVHSLDYQWRALVAAIRRESRKRRQQTKTDARARAPKFVTICSC